VLLLVLPGQALAGAEALPGDLFLAVIDGTPILPPDQYFACYRPYADFPIVVAVLPDTPVRGVRFQVSVTGLVSGAWEAEPGVSDVTVSDTGVISLTFSECMGGPGDFLRLVQTIVGTTDPATSQVCLFGDELPAPVWIGCDDVERSGGLFDVDDTGPAAAGCYRPVPVYMCVVPADRMTWGVVKARYSG